MAQPSSYNFAGLSTFLKNSTSKVWWHGDSNLDQSTAAYLVQAILNGIAFKRVSGFTMPIYAGGSSATVADDYCVKGWNYFAGGSIARSTGLASRGTATGGTSGSCVQSGSRLVFSTEPAAGDRISFMFQTAAQRAALYGGDPFASATNWTTGVMIDVSPSSIPGTLSIRDTSVNDSGVVTTAGTAGTGAALGTANGTQAALALYRTYAKKGSGVAGTDNPASVLTKESGTWTGGTLRHVTHTIRCGTNIGTEHVFIGNSSCYWGDYGGTSPGTAVVNFTDQAYSEMITLAGGPGDVLVFQLGTNMFGSAPSTNEYGYSVATWKTYILASVDRLRALHVAAGNASPRVLLIMPHDSHTTFPEMTNLEAALIGICQDKMAAGGGQWSFYNAYRNFANAAGVANLRTSDGTHFTSLGAIQWVTDFNTEMTRAIAGGSGYGIGGINGRSSAAYVGRGR